MLNIYILEFKRTRGLDRKHFLITSNLKSDCVVLLSILLLVSAFGWILFIRFTHTHTHTLALRIQAQFYDTPIHTYVHTVRTYVFYYFDFSLLMFRVSSSTCSLQRSSFFLSCVISFSTFSFALLYVNVAAASTQRFSVLTTLRYCHWFHIFMQILLLHKLTILNDLRIYMNTFNNCCFCLIATFCGTHTHTLAHTHALNGWSAA